MAYETQIYEGDKISHIIDGASIADGAFSLSSDIDTVVNNSNIRYLYAKVILTLNDLSAAPSAGKTVDLYRRGINVSAALSEPEPDTNYKGTFVGSFLIDAVDPAGTDQPYVIMGVPLLPNQMQFYIQNNLGVTISANWDLDVIPYTFRALQ
jgi:hypothetical protein